MRALSLGEHNIDEFGPGAPIADVIATCSASPFLCEKRMVIARALLNVGGGRRGRSRVKMPAPDAESAGPAEQLAAYVPALPASTHLVVVEDDPQAVAPLESARPDAVKREFAILRDDAVPGWIGSRARTYGARISARAAHDLAQLVGSDLRALDQEIVKLTTYAEPGAEISDADVHQLVSGGGPSVFTLHDAVAEKRPGAALAAARELMNRGADPAEIFAQITGVIRRLIVMKELRRQRLPSREAATYGLSTNPYALQKIERQAARRSLTELLGIYRRLHETDVEIKTGRKDPRVAVELAIASIVGIAADAPRGQ